jgi:hypothetical protein
MESCSVTELAVLALPLTALRSDYQLLKLRWFVVDTNKTCFDEPEIGQNIYMAMTSRQ